MRYHGKDGGIITFRYHVGSGEYRGHRYKLAVASTPAGDLLGMPVVSWDDGSTVTFELDDVIPKAYNFARNNGSMMEVSE